MILLHIRVGREGAVECCILHGVWIYQDTRESKGCIHGVWTLYIISRCGVPSIVLIMSYHREDVGTFLSILTQCSIRVALLPCTLLGFVGFLCDFLLLSFLRLGLAI